MALPFFCHLLLQQLRTELRVGVHGIGQQILLIVTASKLTTNIRKQDHSFVALPLSYGRLDGSDDYVSILPRVNGQAQHPVVKQFQHNAHIQLAFLGVDPSDVSHLVSGSSAVKSRSSRLHTPGGVNPGRACIPRRFGRGQP
jgi:hypothetical protein